MIFLIRCAEHHPTDPVSMMYLFVFYENDTFTIEIYSGYSCWVVGGVMTPPYEDLSKQLYKLKFETMKSGSGISQSRFVCN